MQTLTSILSPERTRSRASGGSKKRLFEKISQLISEDQPALPEADVLAQLIARERLGSTGFGNGIAIPHCRIDHLSEPLGSLVTLDEAIEFDAPDNQPVDLLFVLLVPEGEDQAHLDILAHIAGLFAQEAFCEALRDTRSDEELFQMASNWRS